MINNTHSRLRTILPIGACPQGNDRTQKETKVQIGDTLAGRLFGREVEPPKTPQTVTPVETSQERQGSSLLNALLSPETIRRNVGNIFRPLRPEPKATERTTRERSRSYFPT